MRSSITPSLSILTIWRRGVWQPWENHRLLLFDDMGTHDYNINREFGNFGNDDGHSNKNVKTATGLLIKTTSLHVHHTFLYIS